MDVTQRWARGASVVAGLLLILVGLVLLGVQSFGLQLPFDLGRIGWPLWIIAPGVVLLLVGLTLPAMPGIGLSVGGGIVTTVGLLLAYQASTDHWSSWAYAWALVGPGSVGLSMVVWGALHRHAETFRGGLAALGAGLAMFTLGFAFFEGLLSIGDDRGIAPLGRQLLPVALIAAGVLVIATRLWPRRDRRYVANVAHRAAPDRAADPAPHPAPAPRNEEPL